MTQIKFPRVQRFIFKGSTKVELSLKREFPVYASGYSPSVSLPRSRFFFLPRWITRLSHGRDSQFVIFARWRNSDEKTVAPMDVRLPKLSQKLRAMSWLNETEIWMNLDVRTISLRISVELEGKLEANVSAKSNFYESKIEKKMEFRHLLRSLITCTTILDILHFVY